MEKISELLSKLFLQNQCCEHCKLLELNNVTISKLVSQRNSLKAELDYLKCYESINELLEHKEHLIMFRKNNDGTALAITLCHSEKGNNDFFIYMIGFKNRNNIRIGECCTIVSLNKDTEELIMKISDTKILDEYQGSHFGEMLVDEVFKYAKAIGVNRICGERTTFDTSTEENLNRWNAFWIKHYKCTSTRIGFYKILSVPGGE